MSEVFEMQVPGTAIADQHASPQHSMDPANPPQARISRLQATSIIFTVAGTTFLNTLGQGLLVVAIPRMARDLDIPPSQIQWPTAVFSLTLGCTLLVVGAIADVIGSRPVFLTGCTLHLLFMIGCAQARTGTQLIAFRAIQGIALSLCMPTAVGIVTSNFSTGRQRNIAFACFSGGNAVGFAFGLLIGGLLVDTIGWRYGYYLALGLNAMIWLSAYFSVPATPRGRVPWHQLRTDVDWVGVSIASACLSLLSYVLSVATSGSAHLREPINIALLSFAVILIPVFISWVGRQERLNRPALIPNSLWRKSGFSGVCIAVFLTWAMFNASSFYATLLMQRVQHTSALRTSIQFLPLVIMSIAANFVAGYLVDKVAASILALGACLLSAASPVLLATLSPKWSYWMAVFPAMALIPISADMLFNISNLVITANFPKEKQALAGGVFSTVSQLGNTIGLAVAAAIASSVTAKDTSPISLAALDGYRAAFWTCFAAAVVSGLVSTLGLMKSGKVGLKTE